MKKFITIDITSWENSPYVPQTNGRITTAEDMNGEESFCWYIDSRQGCWSTISAIFDAINIGDEIKLVFCAKYDTIPTAFQVEFMQSNYEDRTTYDISDTSPYFVGKKGDYCLFAMDYIADENVPLTISLSVNDCEITLFSATENVLSLHS